MDNRGIALDTDQADHLVALISATRDNTFALVEFADKLRSENFDAEKKKYTEAFQVFWRTNELDVKFGTIEDFAKYANAGAMLRRIRATYPKYEGSLPYSLRALYEIAKLEAHEVEICIEGRFGRDEVTEDRKKWKRKGRGPLITPTTPAKKISQWREDWRHSHGPATPEDKCVLGEITMNPGALPPDGTIAPDQKNRLLKFLEVVELGIKENPELAIKLNDSILDSLRQRTIFDAEITNQVEAAHHPTAEETPELPVPAQRQIACPQDVSSALANMLSNSSGGS